MTIAPFLVKEGADHIRHRRENPKPPRGYSLFKRVLLVLGLLIGLVIGANAYLSHQGGLLGILWHDAFGGNPTKTVSTTEVPNVARVTAAIRRLGSIDGTQHNYPIQFTRKRQSTFLGINDGSSTRKFDGLGTVVAGTLLDHARTIQVGNLVLPTKQHRGVISLDITLAKPTVLKRYLASTDVSDNHTHGLVGPSIPYSQMDSIAQVMLDQAITGDPTLLSEAQADVESELRPLVVSALAAGQYDANVTFSFVDPASLLPLSAQH